jgi:hypothetical protein
MSSPYSAATTPNAATEPIATGPAYRRATSATTSPPSSTASGAQNANVHGVATNGQGHVRVGALSPLPLSARNAHTMKWRINRATAPTTHATTTVTRKARRAPRGSSTPRLSDTPPDPKALGRQTHQGTFPHAGPTKSHGRNAMIGEWICSTNGRYVRLTGVSGKYGSLTIDGRDRLLNVRQRS